MLSFGLKLPSLKPSAMPLSDSQAVESWKNVPVAMSLNGAVALFDHGTR
jgi:hypothetical protein